MTNANEIGQRTLQKILVFSRSFLAEEYRRNLDIVDGEYDFTFLSDGKKTGNRDLRKQFYAGLASSAQSLELTPEDIVDVTSRCRLLRNIAPEQAQKMAHAMALAIAHELDLIKPQAILSQMVDEYVTHLLCLLSAKRGIRYLGYAYSYFPGKVQITEGAHGRGFEFRVPSAEEVEEVYQAVSKRVYRQNYQQPEEYTKLQHIKYMFRHHVKRIVFWAKGKIESDPWNLHYSVLPYAADRRRLSDFPIPSHFCSDWQAKLLSEKMRRPGLPIVYIPLGYFPESTIDYWTMDRRILQYHAVILDIAKTLSENCIVIVKEHVHMVGARNPKLYDDIMALSGVISVNPNEFSNDVLLASDIVLMGAGSVGVEATLRDVPVVSFCPTSYWFAASGATALDLSEVRKWRSQIDEALSAYQPMTESEKRDFIRKCLQSTARPRGHGKRWPLIEQADMRLILDTALAPA
jgi:hypothetical protein